MNPFMFGTLVVGAPRVAASRRQDRWRAQVDRAASALGLERIDGRWTVPALASYFEEPPPAAAPQPLPPDLAGRP